jgi:molecular chaperone GrpE
MDGTPAAARATESVAAGQPDQGGAEETVVIADPTPEDAADATATEKVAELESALRARTEDLQRLQAEYVNYKRRVDRDRDVARNSGIEAVIIDLMSVLDNLRIAQDHEEMTGGLKLIVDELDQIAGKYGLETYGAKGEHFDPTVHDALMQAPMPGVNEPTVLDVMQVGYRLRGRVLRAARVAVGMPTEEAAASDAGAAADAESAGPAGPAGPAEASQPTEPTDRSGHAPGQ